MKLKKNQFKLIRQWAEERGIYDKGDSKTQFIKLQEEAGELAQAILKNDKPEIKDAIGDMVVVLTNLAHLEGFTVEECIISAYDEIKDRKGKMNNGTFVKQEKKEKSSKKESKKKVDTRIIKDISCHGKHYFNLPTTKQNLKNYLVDTRLTFEGTAISDEIILRLAKESHSLGGVAYLKVDDLVKYKK